jgi:hypothetical protein
MKNLFIKIEIESFKYVEFVESYQGVYSRHIINKDNFILSCLPLKIDSFTYNSFISYYYNSYEKIYSFFKYYNI